MNPYADYRDWKGWRSNQFGVCPPSAAVYFSTELALSGVLSVAGISILEIGFGNGDFAGWAQNSGAEYVGTELIAELVQRGVEAGFDVRNANEPIEGFLSEESIDLVVAFDVFEHLNANALRKILDSAYRVLRPSGRLIARVPSGDSPFSRAIQYGDVTHRLAIGSSMVRQLAHEVSFGVQCVRAPAFPLHGLGAKAFLRRAAVRAVQRVTFPFVTRAFMGGGQPVLTPDMVFVLVKA